MFLYLFLLGLRFSFYPSFSSVAACGKLRRTVRGSACPPGLTNQVWFPGAPLRPPGRLKGNYCLELGPTSTARVRPKSAPTLADSWPLSTDSARLWPHLQSDVGPDCGADSKLGRLRPCLVRCRPTLARILPHSGDRGRHRAKFWPTSAKLVRFRPTSAGREPASAITFPHLGGRGDIGPRGSRIRPKLGDFGRQMGPSFDAKVMFNSNS